MQQDTAGRAEDPRGGPGDETREEQGGGPEGETAAEPGPERWETQADHGEKGPPAEEGEERSGGAPMSTKYVVKQVCHDEWIIRPKGGTECIASVFTSYEDAEAMCGALNGEVGTLRRAGEILLGDMVEYGTVGRCREMPEDRTVCVNRGELEDIFGRMRLVEEHPSRSLLSGGKVERAEGAREAR